MDINQYKNIYRTEIGCRSGRAYSWNITVQKDIPSSERYPSSISITVNNISAQNDESESIKLLNIMNGVCNVIKDISAPKMTLSFMVYLTGFLKV